MPFDRERLMQLIDELEVYEITDPQITAALDRIEALIKSQKETEKETE